MSDAYTISDFYQLIQLSLQLPKEELTTALRDEYYQEDAISILKEMGCPTSEIDQLQPLLASPVYKESSLLNELKIENTRLFYNPKQPAMSIYETTFSSEENPSNTNKVMLFISNTALSVEDYYKRTGIERSNIQKESADHMCEEIELLRYLYAYKGMVSKDSNQDQLIAVDALIKEFEEKHFSQWAKLFFKQLEEKTEHEFYKLVSQIAQMGLKQVL